MFDPEFDTPQTAEQCELSERAFLRRLGLSSMDELQRIFAECDYDSDRISQRLDKGFSDDHYRSRSRKKGIEHEKGCKGGDVLSRPSYKKIDKTIMRTMIPGNEYSVADLSEIIRESSFKVRGSLTRLINQGEIQRIMEPDSRLYIYMVVEKNPGGKVNG